MAFLAAKTYTSFNDTVRLLQTASAAISLILSIILIEGYNFDPDKGKVHRAKESVKHPGTLWLAIIVTTLSLVDGLLDLPRRTCMERLTTTLDLTLVIASLIVRTVSTLPCILQNAPAHSLKADTEQ